MGGTQSGRSDSLASSSESLWSPLLSTTSMSFYGFLSNFRGLAKKEEVAIDNSVFRLHYRYTVFLLVLCSGLLTATQFFGSPITCHMRGENLAPGMVTNYCWIHGTYTLKYINKPVVRNYDDLNEAEKQHVRRYGWSRQLLAAAHPGYGTFHPRLHKKIYHMYYQWVFLFFCIQALMFYAPRIIWKGFEGGRLKFCAQEMTSPELEDEKRRERVNKLLKCYRKFKSKGQGYAYKFLVMELFNLTNAVAQMLLMDKLMGERWIDYGLRLWNHYNFEGEQMYQVDPMHEVFPKMTKCDFFTHSSAGQVDKSDAMCLLPLNIVNEKIFLVLWAWFIILVTCSALALVYRLCMILFPPGRMWMLNKDGSKWKHIASAVENSKYEDWFLLRQMSKNVDSETFAEFLRSLNKEEDLGNNNNNHSRRPSLWASSFGRMSMRKRSGIQRLNNEDLHDQGKKEPAYSADTVDADNSKPAMDNV